MKFYELDTPDGPVLEVRQDLAKKSGHPFKPVEIPTDQKGLMEFLNMLRRVQFEAARGTTPTPSIASQIIAQMDKPKPKQATKLFEQDDIVDIILEAEDFQLANYFAAVLEAAKRVQKRLS